MTNKEIENFYLRECEDHTNFVYRHVEYIRKLKHFSYLRNIVRYATDTHDNGSSYNLQLRSILVLCII